MHRTRSLTSLPQLCALALAALAATLPARAEAQLSLPPPVCQSHEVAVSLAPGQAATERIATRLCAHGALTSTRTVQVLLPGNTYGSEYWDFSYEPGLYSYVRWMTNAGYVTLSVDRIGIGGSSRPPSLSVTMETNAWAVEQVIAKLVDGSLAGVAFSHAKIILVGHSYGSAVGMLVASRMSAVSGLLVSGMLHSTGYGLLFNASAMYPAQLDARFTGQDVPLGYLTTQPGRRNVFYYVEGTDPAVIQADEQTKETMTAEESLTMQQGLDASQALTLPVLSVVGDHDAAFCGVPRCSEPGSAVEREASYYPNTNQLELRVVMEAGHNLNLHLVSHDWFRIAEEWLDRKFGP